MKKHRLWCALLIIGGLMFTLSVNAATHCANLDVNGEDGWYSPNHLDRGIADTNYIRLFTVVHNTTGLPIVDYFSTPVETCNAYYEFLISFNPNNVNSLHPYFGLTYSTSRNSPICKIVHTYRSTHHLPEPSCTSDGPYKSNYLRVNDFIPFFVSANDVVPTAQKEKSCGNPDHCAGNPINLETGSKFQHETDYQSAASGFELTRYYDSLSDNNTALGRAWRHSYERSVSREYSAPPVEWSETNTSFSTLHAFEKDACEAGWNDIRLTAMGGSMSNAIAVWNTDTSTCALMENDVNVGTVPLHQYEEHENPPPSTEIAARLQRANGSIIRFTRNASGGYDAPPDIPGSLVYTSGQWRYTDTGGTVETYDSAGRLLSIQARNGQTQSLSYDGNGRLQSVTGAFGRTLSFTYNNDERIQSVQLPDTETLEYAYNTDGLLVDVIHEDNRTTSYHYEDTNPQYLTGITDALGNRYASWQYDAEGRAISSEHANSVDATQVHYDDKWHTRVTNANGLEETYTWTIVQNRKRASQTQRRLCPSCSLETAGFIYNADGFLISETNYNGNTTNYTRDSEGRITQQMDAVGTPAERTTTTQWHSTWHLPTKITEPGKETIFTYDSQGRLLSRTEQAL